MRTLFEQGLSQRAIARKLKLSRTTVGKFAQAPEYPEMHQSKEGARRSLLDPYKGYLLQRWQHGCRNSVQLYDEITMRGFKGSAPLLRKFLAELRKKHQEAGSASVLTLDASTQAIEIPASLPPKPRIACRISATRASWLFVSQAGKLDEKQKQQVNAIRKGYPDLETAYQFSQDFVMMLAERRANDLDSWLTQAEHSCLPEFKKMAKGIRQDYTAVKAAFSSAWSKIGPGRCCIARRSHHHHSGAGIGPPVVDQSQTLPDGGMSACLSNRHQPKEAEARKDDS